MSDNSGAKLRHSWRLWFDRARRQAERLLQRPIEAGLIALRAYEKAARRPGPLKRLLDDIHGLARLVRAWARGEYRMVSSTTIVLVIAGLVYLLSPVDAILDAIPLLGLIDDAAVLGWVLGGVRSEIEAFTRWERDARRGETLALGATASAGAAAAALPAME
jgi:uncharacterized membrane protein YkvA (DUF1232 family)